MNFRLFKMATVRHFETVMHELGLLGPPGIVVQNLVGISNLFLKTHEFQCYASLARKCPIASLLESYLGRIKTGAN